MSTSITVRFPADLHSRLKAAAHDSDRSLSAEIVHRVRRSFAACAPEGSPHGAQRNAGTAVPDYAALHPGYGEPRR
jgi:hypothetical protein